MLSPPSSDLLLASLPVEPGGEEQLGIFVKNTIDSFPCLRARHWEIIRRIAQRLLILPLRNFSQTEKQSSTR